MSYNVLHFKYLWTELYIFLRDLYRKCMIISTSFSTRSVAPGPPIRQSQIEWAIERERGRIVYGTGSGVKRGAKKKGRRWGSCIWNRSGRIMVAWWVFIMYERCHFFLRLHTAHSQRTTIHALLNRYFFIRKEKINLGSSFQENFGTKLFQTGTKIQVDPS